MLYQLLGTAYSGINEFEKAKSSFLRAIGLDRRSVDSYYHLGLLYDKEGNKREAKKYFDSALEYCYEDAKSHEEIIKKIISKLNSIEEKVIK
jgi:tetratricopeptide (TPR) repeat protein